MGDMFLRKAGPILSRPADLFFRLIITFSSSPGARFSKLLRKILGKS